VQKKSGELNERLFENATTSIFLKYGCPFPQTIYANCGFGVEFLAEGGIQIEEIDVVAFYEKPFVKFDRILHTYLSLRTAEFGPF